MSVWISILYMDLELNSSLFVTWLVKLVSVILAWFVCVYLDRIFTSNLVATDFLDEQFRYFVLEDEIT